MALVEIKSRVTDNTVQEETAIQTSHGRFLSLNMSTEPQLFKQVIPDTAHRAQLLHGIVCGKLEHGFYVVASLRKIIRIVHVQVSAETANAYIAAMKQVHDHELTWVLSGNPPEFSKQHMGHASDLHTIKNNLALWRSMNEMVRDRRRPFPPGRMIIPSIVAMWNRSKGPIDVFSRFLKNCHARHSRLPPLANIWLRLIMTRIYNAYQTFVMSRTYDYLKSDECNVYSEYQEYKKQQGGSFAQFCSKLASDLTIEVAGNSSEDDDSENSDADANERGEQRVRQGEGTIEVAYKKRERYFKDRDLIMRWMGRPHLHVAARGEKPRCCVWCCRRKHDAASMRNHISRHGRPTKYYCPVCLVSLCNVKRFDGQSCHDLFHSSTQLVDYCVEAMDSGIHVQTHSNRPPPPRRGAAAVAAAAAADDSLSSEGEREEQPERRPSISSTELEETPPRNVTKTATRSATKRIRVQPTRNRRQSQRMKDALEDSISSSARSATKRLRVQPTRTRTRSQRMQEASDDSTSESE